MGSHSERTRQTRKGSTDSSRRHRPDRIGSSDSTRHHHTKRKGSTDSTSSRHRQDYKHNRLASILEDEDDYRKPKRKASRDAGESDAPPSYALSQARDATPGEENADKTPKPTSKEARIALALLLALPLVAAVSLMFLITCSSDNLRARFGVLKISVDDLTLGSLFTAVESTKEGDQDGDAVARRALGLVTRADSAGGYLTLGIWGWCVVGSDDKVSCSPSSGWYTMKAIAAGVGDIPAKTFNTAIVHGLLLHGLALLAAMLTIVPVSLFIRRRYYQSDEQIEAGWFQHGTILASLVITIGAWIMDKLLAMTVEKKMAINVVSAGPATTLAGISAILLLAALLASALPKLGRLARHKYQYAKRWDELEDATAHAAREEEEARKAASRPVGSRRRRRGRHREQWRNRMTRMFG